MGGSDVASYRDDTSVSTFEAAEYSYGDPLRSSPGHSPSDSDTETMGGDALNNTVVFRDGDAPHSPLAADYAETVDTGFTVDTVGTADSPTTPTLNTSPIVKSSPAPTPGSPYDYEEDVDAGDGDGVLRAYG